MAFGIPGDIVTAVMLGAMTIHGIQSGPLFITQHPVVVYGIYATYLLAHPIMVPICALGARFFMRVIAVNKSIPIPMVGMLNNKAPRWKDSCFENVHDRPGS